MRLNKIDSIIYDICMMASQGSFDKYESILVTMKKIDVVICTMAGNHIPDAHFEQTARSLSNIVSEYESLCMDIDMWKLCMHFSNKALVKFLPLLPRCISLLQDWVGNTTSKFSGTTRRSRIKIEKKTWGICNLTCLKGVHATLFSLVHIFLFLISWVFWREGGTQISDEFHYRINA